MQGTLRALERTGRTLAGAGLAAALAAGIASADEPAAHVTAVMGEAVGGDAELLQQSSAVDEHGALSTGDDGRCSLLVDDDALLEVCENTALTLSRDGHGHRVVRLDAGSIRLVAEPRGSGERIEVHTPAAIATLLGTIVHVHVDPATGTTTVTSEHSRVRVHSADPSIEGSETVSALQRVTVEPGAAPRKPIGVTQEGIGDLAGCLVDFRRGALDDSLDDWQLDVLDRLADADGGGGPFGRGPGAESGPAELPLGPPGDDPTRTEDTCTPIDCAGPPPVPARIAPQGQQQLRALP